MGNHVGITNLYHLHHEIFRAEVGKGGILFVCFDSLRPINNLSVIKGRSSWVEPVLS